MNESIPAPATSEMKQVLELQRHSFLADGPPTLSQRIDRLDRLIHLLVNHQKELCDAMSRDYGGRSNEVSRLFDIYAPIESLKFAKKNVHRWMRPEKRQAALGMGLTGARVEVHCQPLGVVGVMSTWNFPICLSLSPLAGVFSAGNRAMLKMSEFTPETSALVARLVASSFEPTELAVFTGEAQVSSAFASLPFDHLLYTGNPRIGKLVMQAAAQNLTPVTLELGGKSPVLIGSGTHLPTAAKKIAWGKCINAGQICLAPDYVLLPAEQCEAFVAAFVTAVKEMYPSLRDNPDYVPILRQAHLDRLQALLLDAKERGTQVVQINPANEDFSQATNRRMPPTLLIDPPDDSLVMQEEIFGPLLPIRRYRSIEEAIEYINIRPRPLALYYFGSNPPETEQVLSRTVSGGACANDVLMHVLHEDAPFGGVGQSGMGAYRGEVGFRTFSHKKTVYTAPSYDVTAPLRPPYGTLLRTFLSMLIRK